MESAPADRGGVRLLEFPRQGEEAGGLRTDRRTQSLVDAVALDQQEPGLPQRAIQPPCEGVPLRGGPRTPRRDVKQGDVWRAHEAAPFRSSPIVLQITTVHGAGPGGVRRRPHKSGLQCLLLDSDAQARAVTAIAIRGPQSLVSPPAPT